MLVCSVQGVMRFAQQFDGCYHKEVISFRDKPSVLVICKSQTGRPGVLWFMGSQRVGHDWATELNWTWSQQFHLLIVYHLVLCVFPLRTLCLIYAIDSPTLNSQSAALQCMPEQSLPNNVYFSLGHIRAFVPLGTLDSTSAQCVGTFLNSEVTNRNYKNAKYDPIYRLRKGLCWQNESWNKTALILANPSGERISQATPIFHLFIHVCEWPWKYHTCGFGGYK